MRYLDEDWSENKLTFFVPLGFVESVRMDVPHENRETGMENLRINMFVEVILTKEYAKFSICYLCN